jgi:hypothetical protein
MLGPRHIGLDPGFLAGLDVFDLEITLVDHDRDCLDAKDFFCRLRGLRQQTHVHDLVGDLLLDDQLVLHIDCDLNVVAHGNTRVRCHRSAVGIGQ